MSGDNGALGVWVVASVGVKMRLSFWRVKTVGTRWDCLGSVCFAAPFTVLNI